MIFNSLAFVLFFAVVVAIYFALPHKYRWILLLLASYYFYMSWKAEYALLIFGSTMIDYIAARWIQRTTVKSVRRVLLGISVAANLGTLALFKYAEFFSESIRRALEPFTVTMDGPYLKFLLPVGISFYTFQTLSYTIDVYKGSLKAQTHFGQFALYVSFFPQLVAGPIERASHLLPQFLKKVEFDTARIASGLRLALWGLFKKMVVADRLAQFVDPVYAAPGEYSSTTLLVATLFFAFQIYGDFSGYSDIAIGTARVLGIDIRTNFRHPYFATSLHDFWKRWHISLTSWFRDYLYIPLGGNRKGTARKLLNIFIVFIVSGLWHGAAWTFVIWGSIHGGAQVLAHVTKNIREAMHAKIRLPRRMKKGWQWVITFTTVTAGWVFFRAQSVSQAWDILKRTVTTNPVIAELTEITTPALLCISIFAITTVVLFEYWERAASGRVVVDNLPRPIRWGGYAILVAAILLFGVFSGSDFIYFQF